MIRNNQNIIPNYLYRCIIINQCSPMRLDPSVPNFLTLLRILVAIQIGMKNHEYVPLQLISSIGNLRSGQTFKTIRKLLKVKLIVHVGKKNNGYKLTYLGYDYLALQTFMKRGVIKDVICKIGVGKQSDIYKCQAVDGTHIVLKLTRLGRRSFKTIKNNRQYIQNRTSFNWLYLSRLSSMRQFTFMQILYEDGFPTPRPIDTNRHAIVMSLIDGDPLCNVKKIGQQCSVKQIFLNSVQLLKKFASRGLIHSDFNQFNLLINNQGKLTVIDFPQCISSNHPNSIQYFNRDVQCLYVFFDKMVHKCLRQQQDGNVYINQQDKGFNVSDIPLPMLKQIAVQKRFDLQVRARGHFKLCEEKQFDQFINQWNNYRNNPNNNNNKGDIKQRQDISDNEQQEQYQQNQQNDKQTLQLLTQLQQKQQKQQIQHNKQQMFDQNDDDIKQLINQLKQIQEITPNNKQNKQTAGNKQEQQKQSDQQSQQQQDQDGIQMRAEWKGLTAFQIRQIIKQQRKKQRQKKKQQMTAQQYIKKALNKKKGQQRTPFSKGNYGAKIKTKANNQSIKQGMQLNI